MKTLVISDQRTFYGTFARSVPGAADAHYLLDKGERTPYPELVNVLRGDPGDAETYAAFDPGEEYAVILFFQAKADAERAAGAIVHSLPRSTFLIFAGEGRLPELPEVTTKRLRDWDATVGKALAQEVYMLYAAQHVAEVRAICAGAQKIAILLQHDPDPDAIASGLCFRNLIGRNRNSAPMVTFGGVTRPENRQMLEALDLSVETIEPKDLEAYDLLVCLDVQPAYFGDMLTREAAVVIDHHPEQPGYRAKYRDVRASYGATSTILFEYLQAAGEEINQKQATALLYGIKSDTLSLGRECIEADMEAFRFLFQRANLNTVRRIEKPSIPADSLKTFGAALQSLTVEGGLSFAFLGELEREDVIPQIADLLLQVEGAEWSVAAGLHGGRLVASVRNAGWQKGAGAVVKRVFGEIGSAGGHRSMAKIVVPLDRWEAELGRADEKGVKKAFFGAFLAEATSAAAVE